MNLNLNKSAGCWNLSLVHYNLSSEYYTSFYATRAATIGVSAVSLFGSLLILWGLRDIYRHFYPKDKQIIYSILWTYSLSDVFYNIQNIVFINLFSLPGGQNLQTPWVSRSCLAQSFMMELSIQFSFFMMACFGIEICLNLMKPRITHHRLKIYIIGSALVTLVLCFSLYSLDAFGPMKHSSKTKFLWCFVKSNCDSQFIAFAPILAAWCVCSGTIVIVLCRTSGSRQHQGIKGYSLYTKAIVKLALYPFASMCLWAPGLVYVLILFFQPYNTFGNGVLYNFAAVGLCAQGSINAVILGLQNPQIRSRMFRVNSEDVSRENSVDLITPMLQAQRNSEPQDDIQILPPDWIDSQQMLEHSMSPKV